MSLKAKVMSIWSQDASTRFSSKSYSVADTKQYEAKQVELTPQTPLEPLSPPIGIDVTPFQWSWKEVRKQRQRETVGKYKQKLQKEVSPFSTKFLLI